MRVIYLLLFVSVAQRGTSETECEVTTEMDLKCKFGENINSTYKDFLVFSSSDNGLEEVLIDCTWFHGMLECIAQEGVTRLQPVSDIALIRLPIRITGNSRSYRCKSQSEVLDSIKPCLSPKSTENYQYASSEAPTVSGVDQLIPSLMVLQLLSMLLL